MSSSAGLEGEEEHAAVAAEVEEEEEAAAAAVVGQQKPVVVAPPAADRRSLADCTFFLSATGCNKGEACAFRHCEEARFNPVPCRFFPMCTNSQCRFRHFAQAPPHVPPHRVPPHRVPPHHVPRGPPAPVDRAHTPCYWETQPGGCAKGASCPFQHSRLASAPAAADSDADTRTSTAAARPEQRGKKGGARPKLVTDAGKRLAVKASASGGPSSRKVELLSDSGDKKKTGKANFGVKSFAQIQAERQANNKGAPVAGTREVVTDKPKPKPKAKPAAKPKAKNAPKNAASTATAKRKVASAASEDEPAPKRARATAPATARPAVDPKIFDDSPPGKPASSRPKRDALDDEVDALLGM